MKDTKKNSRRGQTLVEALVALSLLTTGFVGIAGLLSRSFALNRTTSGETQATYLASEGIEIAKNLIDHDVYEAESGNNAYFWGACFGLVNGESGYYELEYDSTICPTASSASSTNALYFDPVSHLYTYNRLGTVKTDFVRNIKVTDLGNEIDVQSVVTWNDGGNSDTVDLEDQFYNWRP